jgi:hypothetical protein
MRCSSITVTATSRGETTAVAAQQHINNARRILEQPAEDLGSDEIAEVTAHALMAIAEHLGDISHVLSKRITVEVCR